MFRLAIAAVLVSTSIACFAEPQNESEAIESAKQRILSDLKDPDSTRFRNVREFENGAVCGEYNAKNSYGGYVGYKHFGFTASGASIQPPAKNLSGDYLKYAAEQFYKRCAEAK